MKVIDKRNEIKDKDWQVGDVICFWDDESNKKYGMITYGCEDTRYGLTNLGENAGSEHVMFADSPRLVIDTLIDRGFNLVKVNAHLVVED